MWEAILLHFIIKPKTLTNVPFPHFFTHRINREVKETFAHVALFNLAISIANIFEPIFLHKDIGLSLEQILLYFSAVYIFYFLLLPLGGKVVSRIGFKHTILLSIFFQVAYWICLFTALKYQQLLFITPLIYAFQKAFCMSRLLLWS